MRFFGKDTYEKMVPSADWGPCGGIGVRPLGELGAGRGVFGHTASHSGLFLVDTSNDFLIVVTSNGQEKAFAEIYPELCRVIADGLDNTPSNSAGVSPR